MRVARAALAGLIVAMCVWGCASPGAVEAPPEAHAAVLPTYAQVAEAHNARVASLDRVWAAVAAIVRYQDQSGRMRTEQAEGHLQIIAPRRVALSLGKLVTSDVYFYLGSNEDLYWWIDRMDAGQRAAFVGSHILATPQRAAQFGAPVHPLDLLDLLGITPLPEADAGLPQGGRLDWAPDGAHILVDVPSRFGTRRMWFDPATIMPRRVEILDERARVVVSSRLSRDVLVPVRGDSRLRPHMADSIEVSVPGTEVSIRLLLSRVENRRERQSEAPFDLERVLRSYPIDRLEIIDDWDPPEPHDDGARQGAASEPGPIETLGERRTPDRRLRTNPPRPGA